MPLERDDFVFRKVNWPLPLRRMGMGGGGGKVNGQVAVKRDETWLSTLPYDQSIKMVNKTIHN